MTWLKIKAWLLGGFPKRWEQGIDPNDPGPLPRGPVRYFDPDTRPLDRVWLRLLGFVPKPLRRYWPFDGFYTQPERLEWAKREVRRLLAAP